MEYKEFLLFFDVMVCVLVEVGVMFGWERFVGLEGRVIGVDYFGVSVLVNILYKEFGIIVDNVVVKVKEVMV